MFVSSYLPFHPSVTSLRGYCAFLKDWRMYLALLSILSVDSYGGHEKHGTSKKIKIEPSTLLSSHQGIPYSVQCRPQSLRSPWGIGHILGMKQTPPSILKALLASSLGANEDLISLLPSSPICEYFQLCLLRNSYMQSSFKYHLIQSSRGIITANDPGEKQAHRVCGLPKIAVHTPVPRFSRVPRPLPAWPPVFELKPSLARA